MNKNINILLNSLQDLDAFSDELERLEGEEYEKGLWDSTRPYSDVYDSLHMIYNYFPKTKEELREIIKERLIDAKQEDPNKIVNLNDIDVSKITDMSELFQIDEFRTDEFRQFRHYTTFVFNNVDISMWDVSNVENMNSMFKGCVNFNSNLSRWNVSKVENTVGMFYDCKSFTADLSGWDVSNVENMRFMFYGCSSFKSDLSEWIVSKVEDMCFMFLGCSSFKSDLSEWKVSKVKDMNHMFHSCKEFNSDLSGWDVSNVKNMSSMFFGCTSFTADLSKWKNKVSNVEDMVFMFFGCTSFTADLSGWKVPKVRDHYLFNCYTKVDKNGKKGGHDILPNLPNEKCPKWVK